MMRRILLVWVLLLIAVGAVSASTIEANDTAAATVSVTISSVVWINIDPDALSWVGVQPGSQVGAETNGYFAIEIENIGSRNITKIWANTTFETSRPWGSGSVSSYDAGNFVLLTNRTYGGSPYYFVNRIEYNESEPLVYIKDPGGNMPPNGYSIGRFRNASMEYFWAIQNDADCSDGVNNHLYIGNSPHTKTQSGTTDLSNGGTRTDVTLSQVGTYGVGAGAGPIAGYCVAVRNDCGQVWFYKWNMDAPGAGTCGNAGYLLSATNLATGSLAPGGYFATNITLRVPYGVAQGTSTGVLTILASDS